MKNILLLLLLSGWTSSLFAQSLPSDYCQFYPMADDPNMRYLTSYTKQESILFEFNPIVRYSAFNNFMKGMMDEYKHTQAWYLSFNPQFRVYNENSFPIKTPSFRMFLGTQHLYRVHLSKLTNKEQQFIGFSFESGHYSNGQSGSAFSTKYADGSKESDSIYSTINESTNLSTILNRRSGNFSTNLTQVILNYRKYSLDDKKTAMKMHSFQLGFILYHNKFLGIGNFGGYTQNDIRLYSKSRMLINYEFMKVFKNGEGGRISFKENIEIINSPHQHVNPLRTESMLTFYPFIDVFNFKIRPKTIGVFVSVIYGHDNYNYRFVDSGFQASVGISWSQFPPFTMIKK